MNNQLSKKELRALGLESRDKLSDTIKNNFDKAIYDKVTSCDIYKCADYVFTYVSYKSEVDTINIIKDAISRKKHVAVPVMGNVQGEMFFYEISSVDELVPNKYGIPEPVIDSDDTHSRLDISEIIASNKVLMLVPGCVYDSSGNRIGYGGGYYDRFFEKYPAILSSAIGLFYTCQKTERIVTGMYDIAIPMIITENEDEDYYD